MKLAAAAAILHALFLLFVMYHMSGGELITDPIVWALAIWAIAPTGFVGWRALSSKVWAAALVPIILWGTHAAYDIGFVSTNSTTALGWLFLPIYEWVFIGLVGIIRVLVEE